MWEAISGKGIVNLTNEGIATSVAFSPDGNYVVSGSEGGDATARIWEALTGKEISRMTHDGAIKSVAFSPDGKYVVSGSDDNARLWRWKPNDLITKACAHLPRNLTRAEWSQYLGDAVPYQPVCENLPIEPVRTPTP